MSEKRSFAAFDIDGTFFRNSLFIEVVYELAARGHLELNERLHSQALELWRSRQPQGYISYRNTMVEILESQLTNIRVEDFESAADAVIDAKAKHTYVYTERLLEAAKQRGLFLIVISGSQELLVERFAKHYGFDIWIGQKYGVTDGKFDGNITKTHEGKDELLGNLIKTHNLKREGSMAVGDTEGDIGMLAMAERAIAFNPNRALYRHAIQVGWEIVVERKDMIFKFAPAKDGRQIYELIDTE